LFGWDGRGAGIAAQLVDGRRWRIGTIELRLCGEEKKCKEVDVRMGSSLISIFVFLEQKSALRESNTH
jgi:hypothetical protein